jgi:hypothetical protein
MNFKYRCNFTIIGLPSEIGYYLLNAQTPHSINDVLIAAKGTDRARVIIRRPDDKFYFIITMEVNDNEVFISASINNDSKNLKNIQVSIYEFFKLLIVPEVNPLKIGLISIDDEMLLVDKVMQRCLVFKDVYGNYHNLNELIENPIFKEIVVEEFKLDNSILIQTTINIRFTPTGDLIIQCYYKSNRYIHGYPDCKTIFEKCKPTINKKSARNI